MHKSTLELQIETLKPWIKKWNLSSEGEQIITHTSHLQPVRDCHGKALMLKVALSEDERRGAKLMNCWNGQGAAPVLACESNALLMQRACGNRSLLEMAKNNEDEQASQIICQVVETLHSSSVVLPGELVPLSRWFASLLNSTQSNPIYGLCREVAIDLLSSAHSEVALHGDIHHNNILDFGEQGWLAIDPKGLVGERGYDYANLFCNPDLPAAGRRARFQRQLKVVTQATGMGKTRLLQWIMAYAGLSASWFIEDGDTTSAEKVIAFAWFAAKELDMAVRD
ncbi:aminoglycoside phosphotransferase family protein [Buttiauxella noackiae]|uniref:aminoglycoside phosphotransferase family protein n=1 Tax=Buttiauxella noackiae TaxID=82992 RepID=UPI00068F4426|nr:aminoglycoside phosphotransferase family protein [Buttiauxella noackiae]